MRGDHVAKKKKGHPTWFKLFEGQLSVLDAVTDEAAGRAIKAALRYMISGEEPVLDPLASVVYASLRRDVDEAREAYNRSSSAGKAGNEKRWGNRGVSGGDTTRYHAIPGDRGASGGIEKLEASYADTAFKGGYPLDEERRDDIGNNCFYAGSFPEDVEDS